MLLKRFSILLLAASGAIFISACSSSDEDGGAASGGAGGSGGVAGGSGGQGAASSGGAAGKSGGAGTSGSAGSSGSGGCGDGSCNANEDCKSCEADCGKCTPAVCGDGTCAAKEDCKTCAADCGGGCASGSAVIYEDFEGSFNPVQKRTASELAKSNGCFGNNYNDTFRRDVCVFVGDDELKVLKSQRSTSQARKGSNSVQFYLEPTQPDGNFPTAPFEATHRNELRIDSKNPQGWNMLPPSGVERWYGFSTYFPTNFVFAPSAIANEIRFAFAQWQHGLPGSPAVAFEVMGDRVECNLLFVKPRGHDCGAIERGKWMDWVVRIVWKNSGGQVEVWRNGSKVLTNLNLKTVYDGVGNGGRFKFGMYYWRWKGKTDVENSINAGITHRELYFDEVRLYEGNHGYDLVRPDL